MKTILMFLAVAALFLLTAPAMAKEDEPKPWSVSAGVGNVWLGGQRPTGGLSIDVAGRRSWPINERSTLDIGLQAQTFGFAGGAHWMGMLGGPQAGVTWTTPLEGLTAGVSASVVYGRLPMCTDWGLCIRYWGIFPGGSLRFAFGNATVAVISELTARYVTTLSWTGAGIGFVGGGAVNW